MKVFVFLVCLTLALTFEIDHDNLVPIYETDEWLANNPNVWAPLIIAKRNAIKIEPETSRNGRIWNGRAAEPGELPYQVGIVVFLSSRQALCGGSIVSANFVLSAASCFPGNPVAVVEIGSVDRNSPQQVIRVAEIILHPLFNASSIRDNDIALVRLVTPIRFGENVGSVRLPNRRQVEQTFLNQLGRISGFGETGFGDSAAQRFLRVAFSPVISRLACHIRFNTSSERTLCIDGSGVNICNGDFGGPLTVQDADEITTLIGIASFISPLGCTNELPGVFTRVSKYLEWIGENSDVVIRDSN